MQRGACFAPHAASLSAARRAFGIVCVPYNRFSIAARHRANQRRAPRRARRFLPMQFRIFAARLLLGAALSAPVFADELSEVTRLHHAGQTRRRARARRANAGDPAERCADAIPEVGDPRRHRPDERGAGAAAADRAGLSRARRAAQQPGRALRRRRRIRQVARRARGGDPAQPALRAGARESRRCPRPARRPVVRARASSRAGEREPAEEARAGAPAGRRPPPWRPHRPPQRRRTRR